MAWNPTRVRRHLQNRTFAPLFIEELGWDNLRERLPVDVDGTRYLLESVAHKRGVVAFVHRAGGALPDSRIRRKIETQVARSHREHVIIYSDGPGTQQVWQWVRREAGKPLSNREHRYDSHQSGESLVQKLEAIRFSLDEEDDLTLTDVVGSVRAAFNVERATKKFYTEFKRQHDAFQKFLQGIPDGEMERWYVSVMLNRLMFLYFIQKKGFLAGDTDYLRSKLSASQSRGEDRYYRDFLCPLFFEGFAKPKEQRPPAINALLGDIPYLNGGIFQQHQVEQRHGQTIAIPDRAFDRLFDFFDSYRWHLDDRPLRDDREINPDVLGYIFEQYINQKQMGAYYTKEDITDYIGKNTIIPFLCDRAQKEYPDGFRGPNGAWMLLQRDPARYIYPAVAKGVELPLPPEIAAGVDDVSQRGEWNTPTPEEYALPTEIWRETVARRQRYADVRGKLERGEVQSINDLITLNLDIRQFAQDLIEQSERPETVRAFWKALTGVSVLDPTCGSGAFLFAALNILEPLYEAALARMQAFVDELGPQDSALRFKDFRAELEQVARHPNQKYFVYKSIVVNNLYGVDIMAEATEIAKLRLFLKLVAQVDDVAKLEPLPDIDFNIRAGNTLVGFATYADVEETVRGERLLLLPEDEELLAEIREEAEAVERLFGRFRAMQTSHDVREWGDDYATSKAILTQRLQALDERLNRLLAQQYGIDPDKLEYEGWRSSHQPFHWFVEFYGILKAGGFDVVIGNPPYVSSAKVRKTYQVKNLKTASCPDIYAWVIERTQNLLRVEGRTGMIVPLSLGFSSGFDSCRRLLISKYCTNWFSSFGRIPSALFDADVRVRNIIQLGYKGKASSQTFTTLLHRWFAVERPTLISSLTYVSFQPSLWKYRIPKLNSLPLTEAFETLLVKNNRTTEVAVSRRPTKHVLYFKKTAYNWLNFCQEMPPCYEGNRVVSHTQFDSIFFNDTDIRDIFGLLSNGKIMMIFWFIVGDDFHVTRWNYSEFPDDLRSLTDEQKSRLLSLVPQLDSAMKSAVQFKLNAGRQVGNYNLAKCRNVTDESDRIFAEVLGLTEVWDDIELYYSRTVKTDFSEDNDDEDE